MYSGFSFTGFICSLESSVENRFAKSVRPLDFLARTSCHISLVVFLVIWVLSLVFSSLIFMLFVQSALAPIMLLRLMTELGVVITFASLFWVIRSSSAKPFKGLSIKFWFMRTHTVSRCWCAIYKCKMARISSTPRSVNSAFRQLSDLKSRLAASVLSNSKKGRFSKCNVLPSF